MWTVIGKVSAWSWSECWWRDFHLRDHTRSWPQQTDQLDNAVKVVTNVALSLPQHVDECGIVLTVQRNILGQLRTEAEVRDADCAAPGGGTFHGSAFRLSRLNICQPSFTTRYRFILTSRKCEVLPEACGQSASDSSNLGSPHTYVMCMHAYSPSCLAIEIHKTVSLCTY